MTSISLQALIEQYTTVPSLFTSYRDKEVILELKPYLQPFEQILAFAELKPFIPEEQKKILFPDNIEEYFVTQITVPENELRERLTYWQRIGTKTLKPTIQVLYELSQQVSADNGKNGQLHKSRRLRYGPHDVHEYRGKFFPQLVRSLINFAGLQRGALVLDPMCGSGTTLCEAHILGMTAIGCDLNPLSVLISTVKAQIIDVIPSVLEHASKKLLAQIDQTTDNTPKKQWELRELAYLRKWFSPEALEDICQILWHIAQVEHDMLKKFFSACLSNIIISISWQKETDLRVRKQIKPYEKGEAIKKFREQVIKQLGKILPYLSLVPKYDSALYIKEGNSIHIDTYFPQFIQECDVLITSPPYATALPYLDTDRLSLYILGLLPKRRMKERELNMIGNREITERKRKELWNEYNERKQELPEEVCELIDFLAKANHVEGVGFRRKNLPSLLSKYFLDMKDAMQNAHKMMKKGAYGFYVVGNNSTVVNGKKIEIHTDKFLFDIGKLAGWKQESVLDMELLPSRDIFKENRGSAERILIFRA